MVSNSDIIFLEIKKIYKSFYQKTKKFKRHFQQNEFYKMVTFNFFLNKYFTFYIVYQEV